MPYSHGSSARFCVVGSGLAVSSSLLVQLPVSDPGPRSPSATVAINSGCDLVRVCASWVESAPFRWLFAILAPRADRFFRWIARAFPLRRWPPRPLAWLRFTLANVCSVCKFAAHGRGAVRGRSYWSSLQPGVELCHLTATDRRIPDTQMIVENRMLFCRCIALWNTLCCCGAPRTTAVALEAAGIAPAVFTRLGKTRAPLHITTYITGPHVNCNLPVPLITPDFRHGHQLHPEVAASESVRVTALWNSPELNAANQWDTSRTFAAFHVYAHLSVLALIAEQVADGLVGRYGVARGLIDSRKALDRARYLANSWMMSAAWHGYRRGATARLVARRAGCCRSGAAAKRCDDASPV